MNTKQLEYILAIENEKSIQKAAEKVFVTQSALSQQLKTLEEELGCKLFDRTPKGLVITKAGQIYCNNAREILKIKEKAYEEIKAIRQEGRRKCNIGVSFYQGMVRLLENARLLESLFPFVFSFIEDNPSELIKALNANKLDLAIISLRDPSFLHNPYTILRKEEILLIAPEGMIPAGTEGVTPDTLRNKNIILSKQGSTVRLIQDSFLQPIRNSFSVMLEANSFSIVLDSARQGKGVGFIPESLTIGSPDGVSFFHLSPRIYRYQIIIYNDDTDMALLNKLRELLS